MSTAFPMFSYIFYLSQFVSFDLSAENLDDINHMLFYPFKTITLFIDFFFVTMKRKRHVI